MLNQYNALFSFFFLFLHIAGHFMIVVLFVMGAILVVNEDGKEENKPLNNQLNWPHTNSMVC